MHSNNLHLFGPCMCAWVIIERVESHHLGVLFCLQQYHLAEGRRVEVGGISDSTGDCSCSLSEICPQLLTEKYG